MQSQEKIHFFAFSFANNNPRRINLLPGIGINCTYSAVGFLFVLENQRGHIQIGEVLIEKTDTLSNEQGCADSTETDGVESSGAAEVYNYAGGDPDDVAGGLDLGEGNFVHGADGSHEGIGGGKHQVGADDEHNAQRGDDYSRNEKYEAQPEGVNGVIHYPHEKVDEITEGYGQRQSEDYAKGGLFVHDDLSDDADNMEGDGDVAEGEGSYHADGIGNGANGGDTHLKALNEYKAEGHQNKAQYILGDSAFKVHRHTDSFWLFAIILH